MGGVKQEQVDGLEGEREERRGKQPLNNEDNTHSCAPAPPGQTVRGNGELGALLLLTCAVGAQRVRETEARGSAAEGVLSGAEGE